MNLAHNHIQDKGLDAIGETLKHLDSVKIEHFGAGANLKIAEQPYWLTDEIAVLGYCEFGKPHLRQIVLAENDKPGVNPLRLKKIKSDLDALPAGKKAILYFHWGMEHVWLPPSEDMILAKTLLEDDRVITIIGMHPHRVQGVISHSGKKAYMCLGNFIFPNFYIAPPVQIAYPIDGIKKNIKYQTRQYHEVYKLTYKKWRWVNRVSLLLEFCTESHDLKTTFVIQDDNTSKVSDFKGIGLYFYKTFFSFISIIYMLPPTE